MQAIIAIPQQCRVLGSGAASAWTQISARPPSPATSRTCRPQGSGTRTILAGTATAAPMNVRLPALKHDGEPVSPSNDSSAEKPVVRGPGWKGRQTPKPRGPSKSLKHVLRHIRYSRYKRYGRNYLTKYFLCEIS
jgi:hypothetical protein